MKTFTEGARALDWDKLNAKASRVGWVGMLDVTLGVCPALLDTPIPPGAPFRPPPRWLTLFPADPAPARILKGALLPLRSLARWLGFLHHPRRPARLLFKWGGELLRIRSLD